MGVVGHRRREGAACDRAWTAKVCREVLEPEEPPWRFAVVEAEAPDDDAAERASRREVTWQELGLGTASEAGSRFVERMLSVVEACRQGGGRSVAGDLTACFEAKRSGNRPRPHGFEEIPSRPWLKGHAVNGYTGTFIPSGESDSPARSPT